MTEDRPARHGLPGVPPAGTAASGHDGRPATRPVVSGRSSGLIGSLEACEAMKILSGHADAISRSLSVVEMWDNRLRQIDVSKLSGDQRAIAASASSGGEGNFSWLSGERSGGPAGVLCGRDAVQIAAPAGGRRLSLRRARSPVQKAASAERDARIHFSCGSPSSECQLTVFPRRPHDRRRHRRLRRCPLRCKQSTSAASSTLGFSSLTCSSQGRECRGCHWKAGDGPFGGAPGCNFSSSGVRHGAGFPASRSPGAVGKIGPFGLRAADRSVDLLSWGRHSRRRFRAAPTHFARPIRARDPNVRSEVHHEWPLSRDRSPPNIPQFTLQPISSASSSAVWAPGSS